VTKGFSTRVLLALLVAQAGALLHGVPIRHRSPCVTRMAADSDEEKSAPPPVSEVRKQQAKARRAVALDGKGGMRQGRGMSAYAKKPKQSEQKKKSAGTGFGKKETTLKYDRKPSPEKLCPCFVGAESKFMPTSGTSYGECCKPLHDGAQPAASPEALVRARYAAFCVREPDYLMATTDPEGEEWDADEGAWKKGLLGFCDDFEFQGLEVGDIKEGAGTVAPAEGAASSAATLAQVAFKVKFAQKGTVKLTVLKETSTFRKTDEGAWLYAKGDVDYEAQ